MPFHPFQALPLTMSCRVASWTTISLAEPPPPACIRTYGPAAFLCPVYRTLSNDADPTMMTKRSFAKLVSSVGTWALLFVEQPRLNF